VDLNVSANALQAAFARVENAIESAATGSSSPDYAAAVVDVKVAQREVESSAEVLETQSEILGYLLDEFA